MDFSRFFNGSFRDLMDQCGGFPCFWGVPKLAGEFISWKRRFEGMMYDDSGGIPILRKPQMGVSIRMRHVLAKMPYKCAEIRNDYWTTLGVKTQILFLGSTTTHEN